MSDLTSGLIGRTPEHSFPASPPRGCGGVGVTRVLACQKGISLCGPCPESPGLHSSGAAVNRQGPWPSLTGQASWDSAAPSAIQDLAIFIHVWLASLKGSETCSAVQDLYLRM